MFHFCLVNEHKVKEQIASFPSIFLARKNICFIKARHFRERGNPPGGYWRVAGVGSAVSGGGGAPVYNRHWKDIKHIYAPIKYSRTFALHHFLCSSLVANDNAFFCAVLLNLFCFRVILLFFGAFINSQNDVINNSISAQYLHII